MKKIILGIFICFACLGSAEAGMISYWDFDEGSGAIAHDSAGSNDGTIYGATWTTGKFGGGLYFDGVNDSIEIPSYIDFKDPGGRTVEMWLKHANAFDTTSPHTDFLKKFEAGVENIILGFGEVGGPGQFYFYGDAGHARSNKNSWNADQWYHLAVTYNDSSAKIYVDGVLENSTTVGYGLYESTSANTYIGADNHGLYFNGTIDEVVIYNRVLTAEEIYNRYVIPEPSSMLLLSLGLLGAGLLRRRKQFQSKRATQRQPPNLNLAHFV